MATNAEEGSCDHLLKGVTVSKLMGPNDANVYGNVHGGHILNLIDEAAMIIASRYCNQAPSKDISTVENVGAALARIEHMDFILPMHIGEVCEMAAEIVYTSEHSLEVVVTVWAENIIKGEKRMTNRARLWYVPLDISDPDRVLSVPPMSYDSEEAHQRGISAYRAQKADREKKKAEVPNHPHLSAAFRHFKESPPYTVGHSMTCLSQLIGVTDATYTGHCRGGVILKLMDECAGYTAWRHCKKSVVTACLEATNFHQKIPTGSMVFVYGWVNFASSRSLEVEVIVEYERPFHQTVSKRQRAVDALLTFVCLDQYGRVQPVPALEVESVEEEARYIVGQQRYEKRKLMRQHSKSSCGTSV